MAKNESYLADHAWLQRRGRPGVSPEFPVRRHKVATWLPTTNARSIFWNLAFGSQRVNHLQSFMQNWLRKLFPLRNFANPGNTVQGKQVSPGNLIAPGSDSVAAVFAPLWLRSGGYARGSP